MRQLDGVIGGRSLSYDGGCEAFRVARPPQPTIEGPRLGDLFDDHLDQGAIGIEGSIEGDRDHRRGRPLVRLDAGQVSRVDVGAPGHLAQGQGAA